MSAITPRNVDIPIIRLTGSAVERGRQYGRQAGERIRRGRDEYARVYAHFAGWGWDRTIVEASAFIEPIEAFHPTSLDEMRGIAEGAGLEFLDVLAMNLRTEILFAAKARSQGAVLPNVRECTAFSALTANGERISGQNWDWLLFSEHTIVMLDVEPDDGPAYATVVEAGLLAKFGMNANGVAIATNALVTTDDVGEPGIPYHVVLRSLLDSSSPTDAVERIQTGVRSSSANYLIVDGDGLAVDAESRPGDYDRIAWQSPDDLGLVLHANHFSVADPAAHGFVDFGMKSMADSVFRLQRVRRLALDLPRARGTVEDWQRILGDHAGHPGSMCCHPDEGAHELERWSTAASVVFEPARRRMHVTAGTPCGGSWRTLDFAERWS